MTTLVALATKDAVIMGCDSLATTSRAFIDPFDLLDFFDESLNLRVDSDGKPLLQNLNSIFDRSRRIPYNHMTDVDKLVELPPVQMGVMYTGITSIKERTIKNLLSEFVERRANSIAVQLYTVREVAEGILELLGQHYQEAFGDIPEKVRPSLDLLVAGYNKDAPLPSIVECNVATGEITEHGAPGVVFAGQSREIERVVYGFDSDGMITLEARYLTLLAIYGERIRKINESEVELPDVRKFFAEGLSLFGRLHFHDPASGPYRPAALDAAWGDFSEQNAIDCVNFLIEIMRDAQRFSNRMPTVGGAVHIALCNRDGFKFISREEYSHEDFRVPKNRPTVE